MRIRILSLCGALTLGLLGIFSTGTASAACGTTFCENARRQCLAGCPCAEFVCYPSTCSFDCICPIFCLDES